MLAVSVILAANLIGLWSAEVAYPLNPGTTRDGFWVQAPSATFDHSWVTPITSNPSPVADAIHFGLYIQQQGDGSLSAFLRNPEQNLGAYIGTRTVTVNGRQVILQAEGRPPIVGQYDPTADTLTFQFQQAPGTFVFKRELTATTVLYRYHVPRQEDDGWTVASLDAVGIDSAQLATILNNIGSQQPTSLRSPYIQSITIARHDKLVLDEYFNGFDPAQPHDVRSAGKSVTTLMIGRAIEDGAPFSPQSKVYQLLAGDGPFANLDPRKQQITVADLMSMQSGYACDDNDDNSPGNEDTMQSQTEQPNWYKYTLDLPLKFDPGTTALYCSAGINLLGAIIAQETHQWLPGYFAARFAQPMQFGQYAMWLMPSPVDDAYMAGGDRFRPRDFLKFGQLFLSGGMWNGKQIIDGSWLQAVATERSTIEDEGAYGWGWHLSQYDLNGTKIDAINAGGNGGQLLFIFPQLDTTLMITAANYGQYPVWGKYATGLVPQILQTIK
jgi:CubicO group peptidase (beta-lactamase class C family)